MGRLVDADSLIAFIDAGHLRNPNKICFSELQVVNILKTAPTAYDPEKVVAELEEKMLNSRSGQAEAIIGMCGASANYYRGEADAYDKAIDIVKRGGAT